MGSNQMPILGKSLQWLHNQHAQKAMETLARSLSAGQITPWQPNSVSLIDIAELTIEDNIGPDEETNIFYKQTDGLFLTKQTSSTNKLVDHF